MDIFAHSLWTAVGVKAAEKPLKNPLRVWLAVFFGVFPDFFSFTAITLWMGMQLVAGNYTMHTMPNPSELEPSAPDTFPIFKITWILYSASHSIVIFAAISALVWIIRRRIVWEMAAWGLHILIDLFTHSYEFYPTPILWPLSGWKFNGLPWDTAWFMFANYGALALLYAYMYRRRIRSAVSKMAARTLVFARVKDIERPE